jgi:hypothetical protein
MATKKKTGKKAAKKGRIKTLTLKREALRDLSGSEKKKIKGGGGVSSGTTDAGNMRNT